MVLHNVPSFLTSQTKYKSLPIYLHEAISYELRRSEVLGSIWSAFDFTNNTITIKPKVIKAIVLSEAINF